MNKNSNISVYLNFIRCGSRTGERKLDNKARENLNQNQNQKPLQAAKTAVPNQHHRHVDMPVALGTFGARHTSLFVQCQHTHRMQLWLTTPWRCPVPAHHSCLHPLRHRIIAQVQTVDHTCPWSMRTCTLWHQDKEQGSEYVAKALVPNVTKTVLITRLCSDKTN